MAENRSIPLKEITRGSNDREEFDPQELARLSESMAELGLQSPIIVRPMDEGYEIVAGERRFRAARLLLWDEIDAIVRHLSDDQAAAVMLLENAARVDLNPMEQARAFQVRIEQLGWDEDQVAKVAGASRLTVQKRIKLLNLIPVVQRLVASGQLGLGHAEIMASLDNDRQIMAMKVLTSGNGISLSEFRCYVADLMAEQEQDSMWDLTQFWVKQVEQDHPRRGADAEVNVPVADYLPDPILDNSMTAGEIMHSYVEQLERDGFAVEAAAIGKLYQDMVHFNAVGLPRQ